MQYEVFKNPIARARSAFPLVAILQSDLAETGRDRLVAFMAPRRVFPRLIDRLMPIVTVGGSEYLLLVPSMTTVHTADLRNPVGSIAAYRDRITAALDWLFLGV